MNKIKINNLSYVTSYSYIRKHYHQTGNKIDYLQADTVYYKNRVTKMQTESNGAINGIIYNDNT